MLYDFVRGLPLDLYSEQEFKKGDIVLSRQDQTDRLLLVLSGHLFDKSLRLNYGAGDLLQMVDFFAGDHYRDMIVARQACRVLLIPRQSVCDLLTNEAPLTWALARMVSIEQRSVPKVASR